MSPPSARVSRALKVMLVCLRHLASWGRTVPGGRKAGLRTHVANFGPDAFVNKLSDQNRLPPNFSIRALTAAPPSISRSRIDQTLKTAPRLVSDQLINIFFQEWAPLYPVVHRPTILKAYEQYLSGTESLRDNKHNLTQLNLIFGIAALASAVSPTRSRKQWPSMRLTPP